jgi:hypothetical protein
MHVTKSQLPELMARRGAAGYNPQAQKEGCRESHPLLLALLAEHGPLITAEVARDLAAQIQWGRRRIKKRINFEVFLDGRGCAFALTSEVYARAMNRTNKHRRTPPVAKKEDLTTQ